MFDYELSPPTVEALEMFRDGNDPSRGERYCEDLADELLEKIDSLSDFDRGMMIIDLLTLVDAMGQTIRIMQVDEIERGMMYE